jgi:hypothetical protein
VLKQKVSVVFILCGLILLQYPTEKTEAQSLTKQKSQKISCPEKWWAVRHPLVAGKTYQLTKLSLSVTDSIGKNGLLDNNINGGRLDAFKHSFWMATLAQNIHWKKAKNLGLAHEKGNYKSYNKALKKGSTDGHDQAGTDMDLWNNEKGIAIGLACFNCNRDALVKAVNDSIQTGCMRIIRMNPKSEFLDKDGQVIPEKEYLGKWINEKCLVPSNFK